MESEGNQNNRRAIGVIWVDRAASRKMRYEIGIRRRAREIGLDLVELVMITGHEPDLRTLLCDTASRVNAMTFVVPSIAHLCGLEREITEHGDIYAVGRRRTYRRGHRWPTTDPENQ